MKCNESIQGRGPLASLCAALTVLAASLNSTTATTPKSCSPPPSFSIYILILYTCHRGRVLDYIDSLWHASSYTSSSSQTEFLSFLPYYNIIVIIIHSLLMLDNSVCCVEYIGGTIAELSCNIVGIYKTRWLSSTRSI